MSYCLLFVFLLLPAKSFMPPALGADNRQSHLTRPCCTLNIVKRNLSDGSTEITKTLKCITIKIKNPAGKVSQNPAPGSKTSQDDLKIIESFMSNS